MYTYIFSQWILPKFRSFSFQNQWIFTKKHNVLYDVAVLCLIQWIFQIKLCETAKSNVVNRTLNWFMIWTLGKYIQVVHVYVLKQENCFQKDSADLWHKKLE